MIVEGVGGWLTNSLALIADAGHMLTDVAALTLTLGAIWFGSRPATAKKTFGYYRLEILAAFVNGIALVLLSIWVIYEAYARWQTPPPIDGLNLTIIAAGGLIVNIVAAKLLHHGHAHQHQGGRSKSPSHAHMGSGNRDTDIACRIACLPRSLGCLSRHWARELASISAYVGTRIPSPSIDLDGLPAYRKTMGATVALEARRGGEATEGTLRPFLAIFKNIAEAAARGIASVSIAAGLAR